MKNYKTIYEKDHYKDNKRERIRQPIPLLAYDSKKPIF